MEACVDEGNGGARVWFCLGEKTRGRGGAVGLCEQGKGGLRPSLVLSGFLLKEIGAAAGSVLVLGEGK